MRIIFQQCVCSALLSCGFCLAATPIVVNTWPFVRATAAAWDALAAGQSAVDAIITGCSECERLQCDGTVGFGGSPDERGETTLDAMIFDGTTMDMGAVGGLRNVSHAIRAAALVKDHSRHSILVGEQAAAFAAEMGLSTRDLSTNDSRAQWRAWRDGNCQPNFRKAVTPDPTISWGAWPSEGAHDTISMLAMDAAGNIAAGTSTNGARGKVPGRVGDAAVPGAGGYAATGVGACGATGDGDVMMRFLPCYQAVETLRRGAGATAAAEDAMRRILRHVPLFKGALVVMDATGGHGAAAVGWVFHYAVRRGDGPGDVEIFEVQPLSDAVRQRVQVV